MPCWNVCRAMFLCERNRPACPPIRMLRHPSSCSSFSEPLTQHPVRKKTVLIIVENLPVPLDRRVWQEACALRDAGYAVAVICPKMRGYTQAEEMLDGIHIYRHWISEEAGGLLIVLPERAVKPSESGREILALCDGERSAVEIAQALQRRHPDVPGLASDVHEFLASMRELGVLAPTASAR